MDILDFASKVKNPYAAGMDAASEQADQFIQSKLKMAMLSKQMEMESNNRMKEFAYKKQMEDISPEQAAASLNILGAKPSDVESLKGAYGTGMQPEIFKSMAESLGQQAKTSAMLNKPVATVTKEDKNGLIQQGFKDPMTGAWSAQPITTLDPERQREINKVDSQVQNSLHLLNDIGARAQSVLANAPEGVPIQKLNAYWQEHGMPTNPDLKSYIDTMGALAAQYQKDLTGMAPRSMELMKMDMGAFPNIEDDGPTAMRKTQIMTGVIQNKAGVAHFNYDPTNFLGSPIHAGIAPSEHAKAGFGSGVQAASNAQADSWAQSVDQSRLLSGKKAK